MVGTGLIVGFYSGSFTFLAIVLRIVMACREGQDDVAYQESIESLSF